MASIAPLRPPARAGKRTTASDISAASFFADGAIHWGLADSFLTIWCSAGGGIGDTGQGAGGEISPPLALDALALDALDLLSLSGVEQSAAAAEALFTILPTFERDDGSTK